MNNTCSLRRTLRLFFSLGLLLCAVTAFAQNKPDGGRIIFPLPKGFELKPKLVNRTELTVVLSGDGAQLDFRKSFLATEAQIYTGLYEGLFSNHPITLEPVPAAASAWQISDDKKVWTFTIRPNARYWNGDLVRAEDFRASWLYMIDPKNETPYSTLFDIIEGAKEYRLGKNTDPDSVGISVKGNNTFIVNLNAPVSYFPSMLCHHSFSPVHPSMFKGDWNAPISNGPFYVTERGTNTITMRKNELYWDAAKVALEKIIIRFTDDEDEAAALWNSGEARWIGGAVNLEAVTDKSGIVVNPMFATFYYYIRSCGPWKDFRLRRALALALPWKTVREGYFLPAKTLIFPVPGYPAVSGMEEADIEEAKTLLEEAGFPKGVGLPELVIRISPSQDADRVGKLMAAAWISLGIPVKLDVVPFNQYFDSLSRNDYDIGSTSWIGDFADPYTFLQMWRHDSNLNNALFNDEDYEDLLERSMQEEGEKRFETLSEAEQLLLDRGTVLPIYYSPALNLVDTDEIEGWFFNVMDIHPFKYLRFKSVKPLPGVVKL
jgi:peptide/nickel transport system substrate-binding protein/oligopeptide transport system substrate-binding protein